MKLVRIALLTLIMTLGVSCVVSAATTTWYAQNAGAANWSDVSGGTTSNIWNSAANGSGSWLDWSTDCPSYSCAGSTFYMNAKTSLTINQDITIALLTATSTGGVIVSSARTIYGNLTAGSTSPLLVISGATSNLTVYGNITAGTATCIANATASTITVYGNVSGSGSNGAHGIDNSSTGTITITGNVTGGTGAATSFGVRNTGNSATTITGNVTNTDTNAYAVSSSNASAPLVTINSGNIVQSTYPAIMAFNLKYNPGPGNYVQYPTTSSIVKLGTPFPGCPRGRC